MKKIIDGRGKVMVRGGRYKTAQHVRWLRRCGAGNAACWTYIASGMEGYVADCEAQGWTAGQMRHNRLVVC